MFRKSIYLVALLSFLMCVDVSADSKTIMLGTGYEAEVDQDSEVRTIGGHVILEDPNKAQDRKIKVLTEKIAELHKKIAELEKANQVKQEVVGEISSLKQRMQALEQHQNDLDALLKRIESGLFDESEPSMSDQ